jgi:hypothetical protein
MVPQVRGLSEGAMAICKPETRSGWAETAGGEAGS